MKVYAPDACSWVVPLGRPVEKGEEVDVDEDLAAGLIAQGWTAEVKAPAKKSPAKPRKATSKKPPAKRGSSAAPHDQEHDE